MKMKNKMFLVDMGKNKKLFCSCGAVEITPEKVKCCNHCGQELTAFLGNCGYYSDKRNIEVKEEGEEILLLIDWTRYFILPNSKEEKVGMDSKDVQLILSVNKSTGKAKRKLLPFQSDFEPLPSYEDSFQTEWELILGVDLTKKEEETFILPFLERIFNVCDVKEKAEEFIRSEEFLKGMEKAQKQEIN